MSYDDAVIDLVAGLNDVMGAGTYALVETGAIGTDAIKVALIYKPATVSLLGSYRHPRFFSGSSLPRYQEPPNAGPVLHG